MNNITKEIIGKFYSRFEKFLSPQDALLDCWHNLDLYGEPGQKLENAFIKSANGECGLVSLKRAFNQYNEFLNSSQFTDFYIQNIDNGYLEKKKEGKKTIEAALDRVRNGKYTKEDEDHFNGIMENFSDLYKDYKNVRPHGHPIYDCLEDSGEKDENGYETYKLNMDKFRDYISDGTNPFDFLTETNPRKYVDDCVKYERDFLGFMIDDLNRAIKRAQEEKNKSTVSVDNNDMQDVYITANAKKKVYTRQGKYGLDYLVPLKSIHLLKNKETTKAYCVGFGNQIDGWLAKSIIVNHNGEDLVPTWALKNLDPQYYPSTKEIKANPNDWEIIPL